MAKLIILCGLPGSGKSSYADSILDNAQLFSDDSDAEVVIHSSDAIREELFGDPSFQGDNSKVFELMHKRTREDLRAGKTVVYDATNITRKARRAAIALADATNDTIECHIVWTSPEECVRRDSLRNRSVGRAVIDKMLRRWQSPWFDEGFDKIELVVYEPDFDQVDYVAQSTSKMHIPHENPHHQLGVWEHCQEARAWLENYFKESPDKIPYDRFALETAAMWHDIGKPYTKFFKPGEDVAHYYDHHCVGGYLAYGLFLRPYAFGMSDWTQDKACFISWLISTHMEPFFNSSYYRGLNANWKWYIDTLHMADVNAH
jgi:predicted kinase